MSVLEIAVRYFHVACGGIALITGLANLFIAPKGGKAHRYIGLVYYWAMLSIFVTAVVIVAAFKFSFFLLGIAILSFYTCFSGYRVLKRKAPGSQTTIDWAAAIITLVAGLIFAGYGLYCLMFTTGNVAVGAMATGFGLMTVYFGRTDIKLFTNTPKDRLWWLYHHIGNMCGSFIAAFTAFLVQNNELMFTPSTAWLGWVVPTIIGTPVITVYIRKYKRKGRERRRMVGRS